MMNMKILAFVTPLSIYHCCSTQKAFCEERFRGEERSALCEFTAVNIKNYGRRNVGKNIEIKDSDKYITLDISLKFGSLDKMRIIYSKPKDNLVKSEKGLITSLGLKAKSRSKKYKKSRYSIGNVSMKELLKIIRDFERLTYESYERSITKHDPNNSYFYFARQIVKCMMRSDALNSDNYPVRT